MIPSSTPFVITMVCTGNLCRSPLAERVLQSRLAGFSDVAVTSGGIDAAVGAVLPDPAVQAARGQGVDVSGHLPRTFGDDDLARSGLVLALAREHRKAVVTMHARASRRTFTLIEFGRLADEVTDDELVAIADVPHADAPARLQKAVTLVASLRGHLPVTKSAAAWDVADPYRGTASEYERAAREIARASEQTARLIARALAV
ncbi:hypothetical protein AX769_02285 [Frondihabitans sp. PAMC 28766]|uniref:arsenate reductase/protein-tyrosine-phosphatase family protein n=1 Tax=Frondihabitans sp. PAMC 28766 TaxID=1795630 RepID=UPI00078C9E6F|nr:hypothetical protein [Frondihabitans sp. PAMC 28766]AMM19171.1 hypothetical protein AX769_02285 [Frondihabitans sp. PAMC 28766]